MTSSQIIIIIIIIIQEFHCDASLETKLQGRYVSRITLQLLAIYYTKRAVIGYNASL